MGPIGATLAHQGGWDEIALVAAPIVLIMGVLAIAKRRADAIGRSPSGAADAGSDGPDTVDRPDHAGPQRPPG